MTPTGYYTGVLNLETVAGKLPPQTIDYKKVFLEVDWTKLFVFTDPSATILKCINSVKIVNRVNDQENLLEEKKIEYEEDIKPFYIDVCGDFEIKINSGSIGADDYSLPDRMYSALNEKINCDIPARVRRCVYGHPVDPDQYLNEEYATGNKELLGRKVVYQHARFETEFDTEGTEERKVLKIEWEKILKEPWRAVCFNKGSHQNSLCFIHFSPVKCVEYHSQPLTKMK